MIGQAFVLPEGEEVDGNLVVLGGSATLEEGSVVRGDVAIFGGTATVAGTVQGNVAVFGGSITLEDTAVVEGISDDWRLCESFAERRRVRRGFWRRNPTTIPEPV